MVLEFRAAMRSIVSERLVMTSGLDQKVQKDDGHRGRSALLKRLCSQDDQEESYESTSLKREEGEPFTLLLILASVVGHFIRKKICEIGRAHV